ncbi:hypothetical protein IT409_02585 [Candidatus Falkowbacteria bacterium]|nr:hypothetical protein [Candidatus Falkowbacteria bacterium]
MQHLFEKYKLEPFVTEVHEKLQGYQGGTVTRSDLVTFLVGKGDVTYTNIVEFIRDVDRYYALQRVASLDASFQKMYGVIVDEFYGGVTSLLKLYDVAYPGEILIAWINKFEAWMNQYAMSLPTEHKEYIFSKLQAIRRSAVEILHNSKDEDVVDFELQAINQIRL